MEGQDDCRAGNYAPGLLFHLDNGEVGTEPYPNIGTARGPIIPVRGRACCRLQDFCQLQGAVVAFYPGGRPLSL